MASKYLNIFNDSRIHWTLRVLVKSKTLSRIQSSLQVKSHFQMSPISMSVFIGFFVIWTTFIINGVNGIHSRNLKIEEVTHPRKNLGLTTRSSMNSNHHHHHHHHQNNQYHHTMDDEMLPKLETVEDLSLHKKLQAKDFTSLRERRKRHNSRHSKGVEYKKMSSAEEREFQESRKRGAVFLEKSEDYEVEVKEAQNNSICDYKVVQIPDLQGNRIPENLEHVICNHAGSRCQEKGFYYCLQTYRIIDVYHGHERSKMKIYAGCVCALFDFPFIQAQSPRLPLDD